MPISLFYWYADVNDVEGLAHRLRVAGERLKLGGRLRITPEGINGTIGGTKDAVNEYHQQILQQFNDASIDFKVSSEGDASDFNNELRVRICKEVVTLGREAENASWKEAAPHLTPEQFRNELLQIQHDDDTIIIDVRNLYETAIGRFDHSILPNIRQFSDFPKYVKQHKHLFQGKRVLMCCTGGVRCERGSVVIKHETEAESIAQLYGGIDTFLKEFPDGGDVFKGKNLVFDGRMVGGNAVGGCVVGRCVACGNPCDDYSCNIRCGYCRSRVLICNDECERVWTVEKQALCERCIEHKRNGIGKELSL